MNKQKIILVGPCGGGSVPKNGASAKNYQLVSFLQEKNAHLKVIDTEQWRKSPKVLFDLFFSILFNPQAKFIVATDNLSGYRIMLAFSLFPRRRSIIYWIIGGSIANWIKEGKVCSKTYQIVDTFIAEGTKMLKTFSDCGFNNTLYVPNFKHVDYIPEKPVRNDGSVKFVFLSRIIPQKGCKMIINAVTQLNNMSYTRFSVDFYGPIEKSYKDEFLASISELKNVRYNGFLDLNQQVNYDELAKYDVMLFPTYWDGEGFPGIAIDAFVSGLPVIATDWSLNSDIIKDGVTGKILPVKLSDKINTALLKREELPFIENVVTSELVDAMKSFIDNPAIIGFMSDNCQNTALQYDINHVLTKELFGKIGIDI